MHPSETTSSEALIGQWREYLRRRRAIRSVDVDELEDHLRAHIATLAAAGLSSEEAFLVAIRRIGALDVIANEFAREHSERLWKQLVVAPEGATAGRGAPREGAVVLALALVAATLIKLPELFGIRWGGDDPAQFFYARNLGLFVLPVLTGYFVWKRGIAWPVWRWLVAAFAAAAVLANIFPFVPEAHTEVLLALHLPIALWLAVGIAYSGGRWAESAARMDFVRFSGELFIYFVLMALGGGVVMGFTMTMFKAIGVNAEVPVTHWLLPCGAAGAVLVAAWLVEAKQSVIENMAPVLTRLFTPLFAGILIVFLGTMAATGQGIDVSREILLAFDLLLALVLALLLYSISARDPLAARGPFDIVLLVLLIGALVADAVALAAIGARISEFGFTPNRVAGLGFNAVLLVNLAWSAGLYAGFLRGTRPFAALEHWQTSYLPVYSLWAVVVVAVFPPLFGYA